MKVELRPGKMLKREVDCWLSKVELFNERIRKLDNEVGQAHRFKWAYMGESVAKMITEGEELYQMGSFSDGVVLDAPPCNGEIFPPTTLAGKSTARNMEEILDFLMNDETKLIGVYGIGGVGKTTIMQHVNNRLLEQTQRFDNVIWVTVTKVLDVIKLQDRIASKFKVDLSESEDETTRATMLFSELRKRKRYVLILDDVWEAFELKNVGIPEPTDANGCKIVVTTRSLDVCRNMKCKAIKMELLSKNEAWNLFLDIVGRDIFLTTRLEATMKLVAKECACLPLAIITIARSMKGVDDQCEWNNACVELREATWGLTEIEKVIEQLKYSYCRLKTEQLRKCLLYCTLYPEDFEIERKELIMHLIDERIIEGTSRQAEFDKGHSILNKLENVCLLESVTNGNNAKCVKMHDLIRDMALQIMSHRCMVEAGVQLRDLPDEEKWTEDLERVSLMNDDISEIRFGASPRCHRLSTLLLLGNGGLRMIPDSFFVFMCGLSVLDLSHTGIEILPNSISDLENLTALLLRWCSNLKYIPSLAKLRALRKLDLCGSGIEEVPEGMEMLVNLRCLNLNAGYLKKLPAGILPKLCRLQCLIVWWASKTLKITATEVAGLKKLETFAGQFHDQHDYNTYVISQKWGGARKYLLQVGPHGSYLDFDEQGSYFSKYVGLTDCRISRGGDPLVLPSDIRELEIKECHDVSSLCHVSSGYATNGSLKYCKIIRCDGIESLLSCYSNCFQSLEVLHLEDLQRLRVLFDVKVPSSQYLEEVWVSSITKESLKTLSLFSCLKELRICKCSSIRKLFMPYLLPYLKNLEEIYVENCEGIDEIIAAKAQEEEAQQQGIGEISSHSIVNEDDTIIKITLPRLKRLTLEHLPELKSIVCSRALMVCHSLEIVTVLSCPKLKRLPLFLPMLYGELCPPPSLLQIEINDREWWESLEWDLPKAQDVLECFLLQLDG